MSDLQARASCCITQSVIWRKLFAVGQAVRPLTSGCCERSPRETSPGAELFALECRKSVWAGTGRDAALTQIAQVLADMDLTALTVIFKTVCVHLTVRGPRPAADISHPKLNRVMDDPRDWPCAKARLYAQSPMSSYPRRTFALRPGRDASHDRYTSTAVPLDDRHVLTLISLEHHELTSWIRLGTGSLDARRRMTGPRELVHGERESFIGEYSWQRSGLGVGSRGLSVGGGGCSRVSSR